MSEHVSAARLGAVSVPVAELFLDSCVRIINTLLNEMGKFTTIVVKDELRDTTVTTAVFEPEEAWYLDIVLTRMIEKVVFVMVEMARFRQHYGQVQ